jgi:hypothetical protein
MHCTWKMWLHSGSILTESPSLNSLKQKHLYFFNDSFTLLDFYLVKLSNTIFISLSYLHSPDSAI